MEELVGLFSNIYNRMYSPRQIKEETKVIFQDRLIDFRILNKELLTDKDLFKQVQHTGGLLNIKPGKIIHIRLYTSTAGIKIGGFDLENVNRNFLNGNTPFVILENSGKLSAGNVNYLTFECVEITNAIGVKTVEVKVRINILQEKALGHSSGMSDWTPNTYYKIGDDVIGPDKRMYNCIESHTSSDTFDVFKFERQGGLDGQDVNDFAAGLDSF